MAHFWMMLWKEQHGAETAEWILIVGLLVVVGIAIYTGILSDELSNVISTAGGKIVSGMNTTFGG